MAVSKNPSSKKSTAPKPKKSTDPFYGQTTGEKSIEKKVSKSDRNYYAPNGQRYVGMGSNGKPYTASKLAADSKNAKAKQQVKVNQMIKKAKGN